MKKYKREQLKTSKNSSLISITLDELVLEGARRLVVAALEHELAEHSLTYLHSVRN